MQRISLMLLGLSLALSLGGCGRTAEFVPPAVSTPEASEQAGEAEQSAYGAFRAWNEAEGISGRIPSDCVLAEDQYAGLKAVVLYTDENNNTECNLAYLYEEGMCSLLVVLPNERESVRDFVLADGGGLEYLGNGAVRLTAEEVQTGSCSQYTVQSRGGPDSGFSVETQLLRSGE